MSLQPVRLDPALGPIPQSVSLWIDEACGTAKSIDCFDYVPSCPELLYGFLRMIPGRRFCEWGSGIGIGVGIAESLGFDAVGIEIDPELACQSQELLRRHGRNAQIHCASYMEMTIPADVVFVYCWPGQKQAMLDRFRSVMPSQTWLLLAEGAERFQPFYHMRELR